MFQRVRSPAAARSPGFSLSTSERDFVVELLVEGAVATAAKRACTPEIAAGSANGLALAAGGSLPAIKQGQLATKLLQHHLGRVAVLARLILPFARLQLYLEINLRALLQILLGNLRQVLVEDDDAVPFGALAPLAARLVAPALAGGHAQIHDGTAILGVPDFRIGSEVANQNDLVNRSRHLLTSMPPPAPAQASVYRLPGAGC